MAMQTDPTANLAALRMRANPAYELVLFDRLSESEQRALGALARDPDGYGVLRPRTDAHLSVKSVSRDTALLLLTLQMPAPFPRYVVHALGTTCDQFIGQLILDSVLEVEIDGKMLSGPAAHALVCDERPFSGPRGALATLSWRALEYASALQILDPVVLSARLYMYNRVPASSRWHRLLPNRAAVEDHLGMENGICSRMLGRGWTRTFSSEDPPAWMAWQSPRKAAVSEPQMTYKLYVSPSCDELRSAFDATVEAISRSNVFHWKVGANLHGLLRPDKLVLYCHSFADVQEVAAQLLERLAGCKVHGVPFTAELGGDGLLSWGIDPAVEDHSLPWLDRESWRSRISNRLANALVLAKGSGQADTSACQFAMERLRLEGVDTQTWVPTENLAWTHASGETAHGAH